MLKKSVAELASLGESHCVSFSLLANDSYLTCTLFQSLCNCTVTTISLGTNLTIVPGTKMMILPEMGPPLPCYSTFTLYGVIVNESLCIDWRKEYQGCKTVD